MVDKMVGQFVKNMEKKGPVKSVKVKVKMMDGSKAKMKLKRGMKGYKA